MDSGPGPEGSSPTMDYRCSEDSGVEEEPGYLTGVVSAHLGDLVLKYHLYFVHIYIADKVMAAPMRVR